MIRLRVQELREARGWTQTELAARANVRRATVVAIEAGTTSGVDFDVLERLAVALSVDPVVLIEYQPNAGRISQRTPPRRGRPRKAS